MLKNLQIENYALIEHLNIDFHPGFSVITGETGAGKSIIIGAIGLLLGQRADSRSIKADAKRCVIEATFDVSHYQLDTFFTENDLDFDGTECIIRRELTSAGKSRAFINDTPASLSQLRELGEQLLDIHSQHKTSFWARKTSSSTFSTSWLTNRNCSPPTRRSTRNTRVWHGSWRKPSRRRRTAKLTKSSCSFRLTSWQMPI